MGMYVAYVYFTMRNFDVHTREIGGDLVLPILGLPTRVHVIDRPTVATALAIAVLIAALLGALVYGLVFRPLRHAPPLARVVASLGVFLYLSSVMAAARRASPAAAPCRCDSTSLLPHRCGPRRRRLDPRVRVRAPRRPRGRRGDRLGARVPLDPVRPGDPRRRPNTRPALTLMGISPSRLGFANWVIGTVSPPGSRSSSSPASRAGSTPWRPACSWSRRSRPRSSAGCRASASPWCARSAISMAAECARHVPGPGRLDRRLAAARRAARRRSR